MNALSDSDQTFYHTFIPIHHGLAVTAKTAGGIFQRKCRRHLFPCKRSSRTCINKKALDNQLSVHNSYLDPARRLQDFIIPATGLLSSASAWHWAQSTRCVHERKDFGVGEQESAQAVSTMHHWRAPEGALEKGEGIRGNERERESTDFGPQNAAK